MFRDGGAKFSGVGFGSFYKVGSWSRQGKFVHSTKWIGRAKRPGWRCYSRQVGPMQSESSEGVRLSSSKA